MKKHIIAVMVLSFIMIGNTQATEIGEVDIHGFISQGYMQSSDNNYLADTEKGTFEFNEMGINFSTKLATKLRAGVQFFARDLGKEGNDEIKLDWGFADYSWKEWLGLRIGKMKAVKELYNETRDMDMLRASILLPQSVYPELYRDSFTSVKGVGLYGDIPLNVLGDLSFNAQAGVLDIGKDGGFAKAFQANVYQSILTAFSVDSISHDLAWTLVGKWNTPLDKFNLIDNLTFNMGYYDIIGLEINGQILSTDLPVLPPNIPGMEMIYLIHAGVAANEPYLYIVDRLDGYFYSIEYTWGDFYLACEFTHMDINGRLYAMGTLLRQAYAPNEGGYVIASYRFSDLFQLGLGYSEYYPRESDKEGELQVANGRPAFLNWLKDTQISFRFDLNDSWIVKLEYHSMNGFGAFSTAENEDSDLEEDWHLFAAKVSYSF